MPEKKTQTARLIEWGEFEETVGHAHVEASEDSLSIQIGWGVANFDGPRGVKNALRLAEILRTWAGVES